MKTVIQLLLVALVVNACVQAGMASWKNYQFKDAIQQEARFAGAEKPAELKERILRIANDYEIELEPADLEVYREGMSTVISAAYWGDIELVPRFYTREHLFEFEVSVTPLRPLSPDDLR